MSVIMNSSDFVSMDVFLDKFLSVLDGSTLTLINDPHRFVGNIFPKTNVHILWAREYVVAVHGIGDRAYHLHPSGVIDLSASSLVMLEYSDSPVKGSSDELPASWGEIDVSDCSDVIFMDSFGFVHSP